MAKNAIQLPEGFDPYNLTLKRQFHEKADKKNVILIVRGKPRLCCGAITGSKQCKHPAGRGTNHVGWGRCSIHGGCCTGPKTEEGKKNSSQNNLKHGLYASVLYPGEKAIYDSLSDSDEVANLTHEIKLQKTKIIAYLERKAKEFAANVETYGEAEAYRKSRVWFSDDTGRVYYHAGTIEDNALDRALRTLRSLIETQNRIKGVDESTDIVSVINSELKAASKADVTLSWSKSEKTDKNDEK